MNPTLARGGSVRLIDGHGPYNTPPDPKYAIVAGGPHLAPVDPMNSGARGSTVAKTDVAGTPSQPTTIRSWEAATQTAVDSRQYGGGETLVEHKELLKDKELVVIGVKLNTSDTFRKNVGGIIQAGEFVSVTCVLREPIIVDGETVNVVVFNDGGVGIRPIIVEHIETHLSEDAKLDWQSYKAVALEPAIYCKRGLRPSDYTYTDGAGNETAATTWYLA